MYLPHRKSSPEFPAEFHAGGREVRLFHRDAFKGGESGVAGVMEKAANSMANRINDTIEKAFK